MCDNVEWIQMAQGQGSVASSCEHGDETGEFADRPSDCHLLIRLVTVAVPLNPRLVKFLVKVAFLTCCCLRNGESEGQSFWERPLGTFKDPTPGPLGAYKVCSLSTRSRKEESRQESSAPYWCTNTTIALPRSCIQSVHAVSVGVCSLECISPVNCFWRTLLGTMVTICTTYFNNH
jgi:hypothetical protein